MRRLIKLGSRLQGRSQLVESSLPLSHRARSSPALSGAPFLLVSRNIIRADCATYRFAFSEWMVKVVAVAAVLMWRME